MTHYRKHKEHRPGFVYLMYDNRGYKFGITTSMRRRQREYITENPHLRCVAHRQLRNYSEAQQAENELKIKLRKYKLPTPKSAREWCIDDPEVPVIWRQVLLKYENPKEAERERKQGEENRRRQQGEAARERKQGEENRRRQQEEAARERKQGEENRRRQQEEENNSKKSNTFALGILATLALVVGILLANEQSQNGSSPQPQGPDKPEPPKQPVINPFDLPETIQLLGDIDERKNELRMANLSFKSQDKTLSKMQDSFAEAANNVLLLSTQFTTATNQISDYNKEQVVLTQQLPKLLVRVSFYDSKHKKAQEELKVFSAQYPNFKLTAQNHGEKEKQTYFDTEVTKSRKSFQGRQKIREEIGALPADQEEYQRLSREKRAAEKYSLIVYEEQFQRKLSDLQCEEKKLYANIKAEQVQLAKADSNLSRTQDRLEQLPGLILAAKQECELLPNAIAVAREQMQHFKDESNSARRLLQEFDNEVQDIQKVLERTEDDLDRHLKKYKVYFSKLPTNKDQSS
jgi:hypothetical protein